MLLPCLLLLAACVAVAAWLARLFSSLLLA